MRQESPKLLTTLRDVAATAVTLLDAFVQIRRERTAPSPGPHMDDEPTSAASSSNPHADEVPTDAPSVDHDEPSPDERRDIDEVLQAKIRKVMSADEPVHHRPVDPPSASFAREQKFVQQRAAALTSTASIHWRLCEIAELASAAIEGDGTRTLPILDAILERLGDEFRARTGPFASAPDLEQAS